MFMPSSASKKYKSPHGSWSQDHLLSYRDGELPVNDDIKFQVCDLIRQEKPTIILTHWKGSIHKDHAATHEIVHDAIFTPRCPRFSASCPRTAFAASTFPKLEDMDGWRADIYLDVTAVWEGYLNVLRSYEFIRGGISSFRYFDYYTALGTARVAWWFSKSSRVDDAARRVGAQAGHLRS